MKRIISVCVSLLLTACLLLGLFPISVSAFQEEHQDPESTATNLLTPVNPKATQEAKNLLAYLGSLTDTDQFVVGQFDIATTNQVWKNIKDQYGTVPAMYSNRYILNCTDDLTVEKMENITLDKTNDLLVQHYNEGAILLVHVDGPYRYLAELAFQGDKYQNEGGTWSENAYGMVDEMDATNPDRDMKVYQAWMDFIDLYIDALADLEARGVKAYMTRPFVEANMNAVFGNNSAYFDTFIRVYRQFVQHFIDSDLTGWLMTYSPGGRRNATGTYPGNEWIDILGVTCYTGSGWDGYCNVGGFPQYDWFCETGKPFGLTEVSCRGDNESAPKASWYNMLKSIRDQWPGISYACCWGDGNWSLQLHKETGNYQSGQDDGKIFLCSPFSINAGNMVNYQEGVIDPPGVVRLYAGKDMAGKYIGLEEKLYTEAELKALGFSGKVGSLDVTRGYAVIFYTGDNGSGDYWGYGNDVKNATAVGGGKTIRSIRVIYEEKVSHGDDVYVYASDQDWNSWKVNDNMQSRWTDITCDESDEGYYWIVYDMAEKVTVNRYIVRHAGHADEGRVFNTRDFQLQYSHDEVNWVTVDSVVGNVNNKTDRMIAPVTAQFFRLAITKSNANPDALGDMMSICEWEMYGVDSGKAYVEPKPTTTTTKKTTTTTKKTTKKTTTTTALKLATPKVTVSNATKGVKVSWGKVSKAETYRVYRRLYSSGKWGSWSKIKTTTSLTYTDESAKAGKNYQYMVKAVKGSVTSGYKATATITRLTVPTVKASNASKGIKLTWSKVSKATSYRVYRRLYSSGKWGSWSKIKTTTSVSYTDTKASAGKNYQYMVRAVKGDSTGYYKATATIRRLKAPGSIKLAKATKGFKVSWSKVTGAKKYEIYRKVGNGSYTKIKTVTTTSYTDKTAKKGKYYTYRVRAVYGDYKSVFKTGSKTKR